MDNFSKIFLIVAFDNGHALCTQSGAERSERSEVIIKF